MSVHPTIPEFQAFLRDASHPVNAAPNARITRHLLAGCPIGDALGAVDVPAGASERAAGEQGQRDEQRGLHVASWR